ncbi:3-hydroxyacyl-CoA dehydrogenase NAD-binding domain-containing protein [Primorskyibacter sp. S187A]|uniref:3-hydroxyacyl-CoA dehydrogenase NAD-binding domain-containing protein n=1 Tax=Primorskyibacter sp. S187A TaxID=3415130 RepID=UPI003C7C1F23
MSSAPANSAGPVTVHWQGDVAWVTIDHPPVNATSTAVRAGLMAAVARVQGARLAVLRGAGRTFVAGGDMTEFDRPAEEPHLPDVIAAIEASETPFLAYMHGNVLGGGLEIAMGCAWRIAAQGTRFGLPEVNVGLIPGAGGTQRAPRLLGWDMAFEMACLGQLKSADDLLGAGGIDAISDDVDASVASWNAARPVPASARNAPDMPAGWMAEKEDMLAKTAKGRQAPGHVLEALGWARLGFAEGQSKERARHLELRAAAESRALRHAFFAERAVSRPTVIAGHNARKLERIAVVGGGLMGAGIAAACLMAGKTVDVIERDRPSAQAAQTRIGDLLGAALKRGKLTSDRRDTCLTALGCHDSYAGAADADLAIEAVFEDLSAKRAVFAALSSVMRPDAILATNTSYLDPREIFADVTGHERCLGLHFFSPAHIMKLLEVVRLPETAPEVLATGFTLAKELRKVAVLAGICDGFIGNRMLAAYRRAAEYLLADGALPEHVDAAMRAFGMAMGPFEAQDMGGLQIAEANRRRQDATRNTAERYVTISDQLCAAGRLGQRAGRGWYRYAEGDRRPRPDPDVQALIEAYSASEGIARRAFSQEDIQLRLLTALANEGARIVDEGIAEDAAAVDMVKLHGYGFPRHRGGPMHWAEAQGATRIKETLRAMEAESPGSWVRAAQFTE